MNRSLRNILPYVLFIAIAGICYLSLAHLLGYYNDDWYLIYAGTSQGVEKFHDVFAIDRPFRGYFVGWMFELFGVNPWLYSLGGLLMRCASALSLLWILRLTWSQEKRVAFVAALLFVVYPGFLDQPNAIDFQSHLWGFALGIISIGCSVKSLVSTQARTRVVFIFLSLVTQLLSLLLMEYYIGLEGLRFLLIAYLTWKQSNARPAQCAWQAFLRYLPSLVTAVAFLLWLTKIYQVERQAVNVESMVGDISASYPLRLVWMAIYLFKDLLNVVLFAWAEPVYQFAFNQRLKLLLLEIGLALFAGVISWLALSIFKEDPRDRPAASNSSHTCRDMVLIGLLASAIALVPIHFGNRQVIFEGFSRFSLPASTGAVMILAGVWIWMTDNRAKTWFVVSLVTLAALAHVGNALRFADQWNVVRNFWWQVSWRIPQIETDTVIIADYASRPVAEDYFVWGPANLIYYPSLPYQRYTNLKLQAATLDPRNLNTVLMGGTIEHERRGILSVADFTRLLVLSQPTEFSCVHVLDGQNMELSTQARPEISLLAPYSVLDRIQVNGLDTRPPEAIFGKELSHGWCYYYQKASLARQRGDWEEIVKLGGAVAQLNLDPYDWIEWMPFLEAYAYTGQTEPALELATIIKDVPYYHYQACQEILADPYHRSERFPEGHRLLFNEFCQSGAGENGPKP